jgi:hypothetical protein
LVSFGAVKGIMTFGARVWLIFGAVEGIMTSASKKQYKRKEPFKLIGLNGSLH